jgi:hypothetical protein
MNAMRVGVVGPEVDADVDVELLETEGQPLSLESASESESELELVRELVRDLVSGEGAGRSLRSSAGTPIMPSPLPSAIRVHDDGGGHIAAAAPGGRSGGVSGVRGSASSNDEAGDACAFS